MPRSRVAAAVALGLALAAAVAGPVEARGEPGDDLRVFVLTFGPGDHPFFKFGHNAIWIEPPDGRGVVFNYGTFSFEEPAKIIPKFVVGRFSYWLSASPADETLAAYRAENRTIEAQELDLAAGAKAALFARLVDNARPENRAYLYDYFLDNCSTRVRDALGWVVGPPLREAGQERARMTFRAHSLRLTADLLPEYLGIHYAIARMTDEPITLWEETFLPERLRDMLRKVRVPGDGGQLRPLVKTERVLFQARRAEPPASPPEWTWAFALAGVALGGLFAGLGHGGARWPALRVAAGIAMALVAGVAGLLGGAFLLVWVGTNHRFSHANANILQCAPWLAAFLWLGVGVALGRQNSATRARLLALAALGLAAAGGLAKALPGVGQDNLDFIVFFVPVWAGLALGLAPMASGSGRDRGRA